MTYEEWRATKGYAYGAVQEAWYAARRAALEEAAKLVSERCKYVTRRCDPKLEMECVACGAAAAIKALP